jgi:antitoxin component of MazEF toxin-antitoxin module
MRKKLTRHGNSVALVIDKPILELLDIDPEAEVDIRTDGRSLVISPVIDDEDEARFEAALAKGHKRYGRMLKRLAE